MDNCEKGPFVEEWHSTHIGAKALLVMTANCFLSKSCVSPGETPDYASVLSDGNSLRTKKLQIQKQSVLSGFSFNLLLPIQTSTASMH